METSKRIKELTELLMILGMCDRVRATSSVCRLHSICLSLSKKINKKLDRFGELSSDDLEQSLDLMISFKQLTGWNKRDQHILSWLSFFLGYCDKWKELVGDIDKLCKHFERAGKAYPLCDFSGVLALEVSESLTQMTQ